MLRFLILLLLLQSGNLAAAVHTVEILVFERADPNATDFFPADPGLPDLMGTVAFDDPRLSLLDSASGRLGPEKYTLRRSGNSRILLHRVWRQALPVRSSPTRVLISEPAEDGSSLTGWFAISAGRFVHVEVDLLYRPMEDGSADAQQALRMRSKGKMRLGALHYLDHPRLGVLVVVYG